MLAEAIALEPDLDLLDNTYARLQNLLLFYLDANLAQEDQNTIQTSKSRVFREA